MQCLQSLCWTLSKKIVLASEEVKGQRFSRIRGWLCSACCHGAMTPSCTVLMCNLLEHRGTLGRKARPQVELYEAYIQKISLAISDISHFRRVHVRRQSVGSRGAVVSAALSERRLRVRSRRSATFTPSVHVMRQSLPVWPPTLNKIPLPFLPFFACLATDVKGKLHSKNHNL